ncbi:hypothetical protein ACPCK8_15740 [Streptomyces cellulosae]
MRQKLSKGMIVAGAATSILSVCAIPAFADSDTREATADTLGALAYDAPGLVEPGASETGSRLLGDEARSTGDRSTVAGYGDDNAGDGAEGRTSHTPRQDGSPQGVGADVVREVGRHVDDVRGVVGRVGEEVGEHLVGGAFPGRGEWIEEEGGYGDDGDMSEPPVSEPTAPPVTSPTTTPSAPTPEEAPPAVRPHGEPPSLAQTGAGDEMVMVSGAAAALLISGVLVYRRGRVTSRG